MYGAIVRQVTTAGAGPIFVANVAHNINDATHCAFIIQDVTPAVGVARVLELAFIAEATGKGANTDVLSDVTTAGRVTMDALIVAQHSLIDVGPIVNGITRTAAQVSSWVGVTPVRRPMRSLHRNVPFLIANGNATSAAVVVTHLLGTANTVVFCSPSSDPTVLTGAAVPIPMKVSRIASAATTVTLQAQTATNVVSTAGVDTTVTFDVMVLARWGFGAHSRIVRQHSTTFGGGGAVPLWVDGDDYAAGDRQLTPAQAQGFRANPSYAALYTNVDGIVVAAGGPFVHNMGSSTSAMALVQLTGAVGGGAVGTGYIINNALSVNSMTLARVDANIDNAYVGFFRPYSPVCR